jgi:glycosyltransferase involved in cell wall biosynthesis
MRPATEFSIVIPTFRRAVLLRAAVVSCLNQKGIDVNLIEVIVVDNSPEASAHDLVRELAAMATVSGISLRYIHEPRSGISHARNSGVFHAAGTFIAFLDDDEAAGPLWLKALHDCLVVADADFVMGPVTFEFDAGAQSEIEFLRWCYGRRWHGASGEAVDFAGMGNSLLRKDRCIKSDAPFDPELGLTGGEDARFLAELRSRGGRVVWCAEAGVSEYCPASRTTFTFIMRRMLRRGQIHTRALCWRRPVPAARKCLAKAALGTGKVFWAGFLTRQEYGGASQSEVLDMSQRQ